MGWLGAVLFVGGGILLLLGVLHLGTNLTAFPKPKEGAHALVTTGVYSIVRHPIYTGFMLGALGWSLWWGTLLGIALDYRLVCVVRPKSQSRGKLADREISRV